MQFKQFQWKTFWYSFALKFLFAIGGGIVTYAGMPQYEAAVHPALTPPSWLFPVVWTILFVLMGIASYLIYRQGTEDPQVRQALVIYGIQLLFNFFWPIFFFRFGWYLFSFFWLVILWVLILVMISKFRKIDETAAKLLVPYLLWVTFAAYLNFGVFLMH